MKNASPVEFNLATMLPEPGHTTIQASAGTGKTFSIAGLVAQFIIRGVPISKILLVTFGNAASAELQDRVRDRLSSTADWLIKHLSAPSEGDGDLLEDPIAMYLSSLDQPRQHEALGRVRSALNDFDEAQISTIHAFSSLMLRQVGQANPLGSNYDVVGDIMGSCRSAVHDTIYRLTEDLPDLAVDSSVVDEGLSTIDVERTIKLVNTLIQRPDTQLCIPNYEHVDCTTEHGVITVLQDPAHDVDVQIAALQMLVVHQALAITKESLLQQGIVSHDMQVSALRDVLRDRPSVVNDLRLKFTHVLIDEFQDTDEIQWDVFYRAFLDTQFNARPSTVVTVGDPKQAIYSFRGSDIQTYLEAIQEPERTNRLWTLSRNFRSTPDFIEAMNALWDPIEMGSSSDGRAITYQQITAGKAATSPGVYINNQRLRPVVLRTLWVPEAEPDEKQETLTADDLKMLTRRELPQLVRDLLKAKVVENDRATRSVRLDDIVIVTRTRDEVQTAFGVLQRAGIPAVMVGGSSVMDTTMALHLKWFLAALALPHDIRRAKVAALTFFGPPDLDVTNDDHLAAFQADLMKWNQILAVSGVMAFAGRLQSDLQLNARLIGQGNGERHITDFEHLIELLAEATGFRGVEALRALTIFEDLAFHLDSESEAWERRADTSEPAVQIMTVHKSKGLEFNIVIAVNINAPAPNADRLDYKWQDEETGQRVATLYGIKTGIPNSLKERLKATTVEEEIRLIYVALTRAKFVAITWASFDVKSYAANRLGRVLDIAGERGSFDKSETFPLQSSTKTVVQSEVTTTNERTRIPLAELTDPNQTLPRELASAEDPQKSSTDSQNLDEGRDPRYGLERAELPTRPQQGLGRWSFSSWSTYRPLQHVHFGEIKPVSAVGDDELQGGLDELSDIVDDARISGSSGAPSTRLLLDGLGAGTEFGTLIHSVLEEADFQHEDLESHLTELLQTKQLVRPVIYDIERAGKDLAVAIQCELPNAMGLTRLDNLARRDRIDELEFEIPLAPGELVDLQGIGAILVEELDRDDPYQPWAHDLAKNGSKTQVTGSLTGFIDLVYRSYQPNGTQQFHVVDYKTNWLHLGAPESEAESKYQPLQLIDAMNHANYPLQAILYNVALHRYLTWRLPEYEPSQHLGASGYFFLRGMVASGSGVAVWHPHHRAVEALSEFLHRPQNLSGSQGVKAGVRL